MAAVIEATSGPTGRVGRAGRAETPARLRLWMLSAMLTALALAAAGSVAMSRTQDQVGTIGDEAAPQAATASDLYFSLSDLDAQVARLVLVGTAESQAGTQIDALTSYRDRGRQIDADLERALTTATSAEDRATIRKLLDDLAAYRRWAWQALAVEWQQPAQPPGQLPEATLGYYSQATNVMHFDLLPGAKRLREASQARLDRAYADQRHTEAWGVSLILVLGVALVVLLIAAQLWLVRRFRRRFNPALLAGTLLTLVLVGWATGLLLVEGARLGDAQEKSFEPYLAASQVQAISYDAAADTSRYLLSAELPQYRQDFTNKSKCLVQGGACGTGGDSVTNGLAELAAGRDTSGAAGQVVERWQGYQRDHEKIVGLADTGKASEAVEALTGIKRGEAAFDFYYYDIGISQIAADREAAFDVAFRDAEDLLRGWMVIPLAAMSIVVLLVPVGLWPRLSEYR